MPQTMVQELETLCGQISTCQACKLHSTRTNTVFGAGCPTAPVMFIGEGPGENEDLKGEPFVGQGGQLLDKMMFHVGLSRDTNVYITNVVKCRPPKNRDPEKDEIQSCIGYLRNQVFLIRPKVIVCLGRVSARALINANFLIRKQHGEFFEKNGTLMMGTFHPAALLRDPASKPDGLEDFIKLRRKLDELGVLGL